MNPGASGSATRLVLYFKQRLGHLLFALALSALIPVAMSCASARAEFQAGVRHYDSSEYDQALTAFTNAYHAKPDAAFLFNIAQCHRKLGHIEDAIKFYQAFLREAPDAKNRSEVERKIAELERQRGESR